MPNGWEKVLHSPARQKEFAELMVRVQAEYLLEVVYPPEAEVFTALELCAPEEVKVVILGQDPYHGEGQAHGLAFSVRDGGAVPPSLRNIFKEVARDVGGTPPQNGDLSRWAAQGVLLLNSVLTVQSGEPGSHRELGWQALTDSIIKKISDDKSRVVFILWGAYAGAKRPHIDEAKHLVLTAPHPSPLSAYRGFLGCCHFSGTNAYLRAHGKTPIKW